MTQQRASSKFTERPGARARIFDALAHGVAAIAERVAAVAEDRAPVLYGGLKASVGWAAYQDGRKIAGPDDAPADQRDGGIVAVAGAGFPGRFNETGTENMAAQPFLGPAAAAVVSSGEAARALATEANRRLGGP